MITRLQIPRGAAALIAAGLLSSAAPAAPESAEFTFAQVCDTQLGMGGYEHDVRTFKLAVEQLNEMAPDFVLICGDLVNNADDKSFADFNRIKSGFRIPCHCAAGNHDVGKEPTAASLKRYREKIGKDYFSFGHKGIQMVSGETTSKNFDKRPMGFRIWRAGKAGALAHQFVTLKDEPAAADPAPKSP